ncbi:LysR family transcriptional regulator [Algiphilus sp.]|nr:LysR family transcriptional regulator [Algiphilus sp.]MBY8966577.1 LysR family transcriptional regulator [Algiphilus acroporae]MCI5103216.1 LysR family transcriptional regulator [Algiphilus sp.]MCR9090468.1 LysR family transcriptional regulator [Pseudomonadota bacterium]
MAAKLNYNHLYYFWVVAHEAHLTRAAGKLCVSQSALSVQIRKLEDQLGHPLFERRGRRLELTEAGQMTLDYADAIFAAGNELLGTLREAGRVSRRRLTIGALATLSRNLQRQFLAPVLGDADVSLVLRSGSLNELMQALESHNVDIVLANQVPLRTDTSAWTVFDIEQQPVSLIGAASRDSAGGDLRHLLRQHPLLLPSRDSGVRTGFDALAVRLGVQVEIAAEVDDMAMMRLLARENIGVAVLPPIVVRDELRDGSLRELAVLPGISETFSAITLERRFPNPLVTRLLSASAATRKDGVAAR